jgi:hypothetical protein
LPKSLSVKATWDLGAQFETIAHNGEIKLSYNNILVDSLSSAEVTACLRHEACHVFTLVTTDISVPQTKQEMMNFLVQHTQSYDEYMAHREFIKRWPDDTAFGKLREKEIANHENRLSTLREILRRQEIPKYHPYYYEQLSDVFQDSVYIRLSNPSKMKKWCPSAVHEFFEFWLEDSEYIHGGSFDREKIMEMAQLSATLSMSVDADKMLNQNVIAFNPGSDKLHELYLNGYLALGGLIQKWIDRESSA